MVLVNVYNNKNIHHLRIIIDFNHDYGCLCSIELELA